jgi:hypothetical protein
MYYDFSRQLLKARQYYEQPERFQIVSDNIAMWIGDGVAYVLQLEDGSWQCECYYALQCDLPCAHAQALERLLAEGLVQPKKDASTASQAALIAPEPQALINEPLMAVV